MKTKLYSILQQVQRGEITAEKALEMAETLPFSELEFAKVDHHREISRGIPEVIYAPGKTPTQIINIARRILESGANLLVTRLDPAAYAEIKNHIPDATYSETARTLKLEQETPPPGHGLVLVVSAGTSDIPVAEEAAVTSEFLGNQTQKIYDVGVAGLHRLLSRIEILRKARVIITVAGMEGALPSVVAGLVRVPVIAVPTSIGYGASFSGLAALLTMLNSCPGGVAVVNIDNGFGAAYLASVINHL